MPMTLTAYWEELEQDVSNLELEMSQAHVYQNYPPVAAARGMIAQGIRIEGISLWTGALELSRIETEINRLEADIGDPIPGQSLHQPRLNDDRDFFFAAVYYQHQQRFADVQSSKTAINVNLRRHKPQVAQNAATLNRLLSEYYTQHQARLDEQMNATPGETVNSIRAWLRAAVAAEPEPVNNEADAPSFESLMAPIIQQEFYEIILNGEDAQSIVTHLRNHFEEKEDTITKMYHIKRLLHNLSQQGVRLENLNAERLSAFLNVLSADEQVEWRAKIEAALQPPPAAAPVEPEPLPVVAAPASSNLRQKGASLVSRVWSFGKGVLERTGELIKPWSPGLVTDVTQTIYHFSTGVTERTASGLAYLVGALPTEAAQDAAAAETADSVTLRELNDFANQRYNMVAQNLITADNGLTLGDARRANSEELLRLKDKMAVLNSVLVLDKQMEDFISTHNKGLVKFIDFFRPVNLFLSRTFFRYVLHDKALLLEEARQLKKSLVDIKRDLEQNADPDTVKTRLLDESDRTRTSVAQVSQNSRYVFLSPAHRVAARRAAEDVSSRIQDAIRPVTAPAA